MSHAREKPAEVTVGMLLEVLGCVRATLYRYIERGLMPRPVQARRGRPALWSADALARARKLRKLLDQGYTLAAAEERLGEL